MRHPAAPPVLLAIALACAVPAGAADGRSTPAQTIKRNSVQLAHDAHIQAQRAAAGFKRGARELGHTVARDTRNARTVVAQHARATGHSIRSGARRLGTSVQQGARRARQGKVTS